MSLRTPTLRLTIQLVLMALVIVAVCFGAFATVVRLSLADTTAMAALVTSIVDVTAFVLPIALGGLAVSYMDAERRAGLSRPMVLGGYALGALLAIVVRIVHFLFVIGISYLYYFEFSIDDVFVSASAWVGYPLAGYGVGALLTHVFKRWGFSLALAAGIVTLLLPTVVALTGIDISAAWPFGLSLVPNPRGLGVDIVDDVIGTALVFILVVSAGAMAWSCPPRRRV